MKGGQLELDGYCPELGLAFEYQGKQHYVPEKFFNTTRTLEEQKRTDELKRVLCKQNDITLIEVPYTVKYEDMLGYIAQECTIKKVKAFPAETDWMDHKQFGIYPQDKLKEMQEFAASKGGKCLSTVYLGAHKKSEWECAEGHRWYAAYARIKFRNWCPICRQKRKRDPATGRWTKLF